MAFRFNKLLQLAASNARGVAAVQGSWVVCALQDPCLAGIHSSPSKSPRLQHRTRWDQRKFKE
jgi:hypothetical protein